MRHSTAGFRLARPLGYPFTLVAQIVRQLAIAVDLATLCPGLPDQLVLPHIFLRAMAQRLLEPCMETGEVDP
jgi:hypothetical protein